SGTRSRPLGRQQVIIDATPAPPTSPAVWRADTLIAQAQWGLHYAQPPLNYFEQSALEGVLRRLVQARAIYPSQEHLLITACDDLDRLRQRITQWASAPNT